MFTAWIKSLLLVVHPTQTLLTDEVLSLHSEGAEDDFSEVGELSGAVVVPLNMGASTVRNSQAEESKY